MRARRGRGAQLAAGAASRPARAADAILFLHADSRLPPGYGASVEAALASAPWGCFATARPTGLHPAATALLQACIGARTRWLGLPYGDQGIFAARAALDAVGGVDASLPLMEDVDLVARLTAASGAPAIVAGAVATSGRRWAAGGLVRTTVHNLWTLARYRAGVPAAVLAHEYYGRRRRREGKGGD